MEKEEEEKEWKEEWIESYMKGRKIRGKIKEGGGESREVSLMKEKKWKGE